MKIINYFLIYYQSSLGFSNTVLVSMYEQMIISGCNTLYDANKNNNYANTTYVQRKYKTVSKITCITTFF